MQSICPAPDCSSGDEEHEGDLTCGFHTFEIRPDFSIEHTEIVASADVAQPVGIRLVVDVLAIVETAFTSADASAKNNGTAREAVVHLGQWAVVMILGSLRLQHTLAADESVATSGDFCEVPTIATPDGNELECVETRRFSAGHRLQSGKIWLLRVWLSRVVRKRLPAICDCVTSQAKPGILVCCEAAYLA